MISEWALTGQKWPVNLACFGLCSSVESKGLLVLLQLFHTGPIGSRVSSNLRTNAECILWAVKTMDHKSNDSKQLSLFFICLNFVCLGVRNQHISRLGSIPCPCLFLLLGVEPDIFPGSACVALVSASVPLWLLSCVLLGPQTQMYFLQFSWSLETRPASERPFSCLGMEMSHWKMDFV